MAVFSNWMSTNASLIALSAGLLIALLLSVLRKSGITRDGKPLR